MLFRYYIMPNITWGETEKQGSWKWRVLQNPFFSSRWIPKGGIFWWRKERGNIAWAVQTQDSFWWQKFRCKGLGAWEQVGQELLCQMTDKVKHFYTSFKFFSSCLRKGHDPDVLHLLAQRQKVRTRERKKIRMTKTSGYVFKSNTCALKFSPWCSTGLYEVLAHAGVGERLICTFWRVEREWREGDQ